MNEHLTEEAIQDFFDESLDPAPRLEAETHLAECPECAEVLDELRSLRTTLRGLPKRADRTPAFATFDSGHSPRPLPIRSAGGAEGRRRALWRVAGTAAAFAVGIVVGGALGDRVGEQAAGPAGGLRAMEVATEVQRTGTAYAAAVAALGDLTDRPGATGAFFQGREAALSVLYAATLAYAGLEPSDGTVGRILEAVEAARRQPAEDPPATNGF